MSNHTVAELLAWMDGKSKTYGWDALVTYDQRKTNDLLHQQYIERFNEDSYLPLITVGLPSSGYSTEYLYGLKLSVPKLSFQNADLQSSKADLTMDMVGGLIISRLKPPGIPERLDRIQQVLPLGGPQLTMTLPLESTPGTVNKGQVTLDISKGDNFRANFVIGDLDQQEIGARFKVMFQRLNDEQKVFSLGSLYGESNDVLTPERFQTRTLAAPLANRRGEANYGDGAVVMFITFKGGRAGNIPPKPNPDDPNGFRYLIPKDEGGEKYTGSMLLSNRVLFDKVIGGGLAMSLGHDTKFKEYDGASDIVWSLSAVSGSIPVPDFDYRHQTGGYAACLVELFDPNFRFAFGSDRLKIARHHSGLLLTWSGANFAQGRVSFKDVRPPYEQSFLADFIFRHGYEQHFDPVVDKNSGVVNFIRSPVSPFEFGIESTKLFPNDDEHLANLKDAVSERIVQLVDAAFKQVEMPSVDTFLARNLLFPGTNTFQLSQAHVPGDLALFGHIDPVRTSMVVTPAQSLMEAGTQQQFQVAGGGVGLPSLLWSVRDTEGEIVDVGTISPAGRYIAPPASSLGKGYASVLVTAEGVLDGKPVKASALVSIIDSTIAVNPIFQVAAPLQELKLTAETLDGTAPEWEGDTLSPDPDNPHHRIYKAGPRDSTQAFTLDTVRVRAAGGTAKTVKLLIPNFPVGLAIRVDDSSDPGAGEVRLQVLVDGEVLDPEETPYTLKHLDGGGHLDATTGIYKEPASTQTSFAIITVEIGRGTFGHYGFIVLPLPLKTYSDRPERFNETNP